MGWGLDGIEDGQEPVLVPVIAWRVQDSGPAGWRSAPGC